jgi:hypothetical protein
MTFPGSLDKKYPLLTKGGLVMKKIWVMAFVVVAAAAGYAIFSSCGGSSTSGNKLVDPYIVGAILYEDVNGDGVQDATEQISTATDADGNFTFPNALTAGSIIRLTTTKGTHNGVAYDGDIRSTVTDIAGNQVVSPLTTLLANGWTAQNVVDVLTAAGITVTTADLTLDPMSKFNMTDTISTITDAKLADIQASIAIYCFLSIIEDLILSGKVTAMTNGFNLTYAIFISHPNYAALLANMVAQIKLGLSTTVLQTIDTTIQAAKVLCPETQDVTISEIIKGSVAISNYVIPKVVDSCDSGAGFPTCSWAPNTAYFSTWSGDLGESFYVIRTKDNTCTTTAVSMGLLPNVLANTYCTLEGATDAAAAAVCY